MDKQISTPNSSSNSCDKQATPGDKIAGQYEVVQCLGVGKHTTVYKCTHDNFPDQEIVLKVLHSGVASDEVAAARFQKEILASYEVNNSHVIRTYEFVTLPDLIAYTMEFAAHGDLRERFSKKIQFSIDDVIMFAAQLCTGLQAIHDAGIVHRDIKPENLFFTDKRNIKIADFGIVHTDGGRKLTQQGEVLGAVDYVSPEYVEKGQLDKRSDIYGLGLVVYEMLTGNLAFPGKSVMDALMKRLTSDPLPPSELRADCPEELEAIILKMLTRNPEQRFQSASEALEKLQELAPELMPIDSQSLFSVPSLFDDADSSSQPPQLGNTPSPSVVTADEFSEESEEFVLNTTSPGRNRLAAVAIVLIILGCVGFLFFSDGSKPVAKTEPVLSPVNGVQTIPAPKTAANLAPSEDTVSSDQAQTEQTAGEVVDVEPIASIPVETGEVAAETTAAVPAAAQPEQDLANSEQEAITRAQAEQQPRPLGEPTSVSQTPKVTPIIEVDSSSAFHIVLEGETISGLSLRYGVAERLLMEANGVIDPRKLPTGIQLKIPR